MNSVTSEKTTEYYELSPEGTSSSTQHTRFRLAVAEKTQALYIFYSNHVKTCSCQSYCLQSQNTSSRKKKNFFFTAKVKIAACLTAVSKLALNTLIGMPTMVQGPNET